MNDAVSSTVWSALAVPGLQFDWPWLLILLPLPLIALLVGGKGRQTLPNSAQRAPSIPPALSAGLTAAAEGGRAGRSSGRLLDWLIWCALVVAIAQPTRPGAVTVTPVSGRALVLAVDLSGSMERKDFTLDGVTDNRLRVVQRVASDFIMQRQGDRIGLVVFGKEAFSAAPLTFDLFSVADTLDGVGIGMTGRSTAIGDAIGLSLQMLREDPAREKAIVLLSDGTNNAGSVEPEAAATLAQTLGVRIHTIALGSDRVAEGGYSTAPSADLDEATLEAIADSAQGAFFRARTSDELSAIYDTIDQLESAAIDAPPSRPRADLRHWPLIALGLLLLISIWREARR